MTKITIEQEGEKPIIMEGDSFFVFVDGSGASWNGVDTHLCKMLELYADKIINERREAINGNSK